MRKFHFSSFLGTQSKQGTVAIFHRLHPCPIYVNKTTWDEFRKGARENSTLRRKLQEQKLMIRSEDEDLEVLEATRSDYGRKIAKMASLYLILTHKCNLRCSYCYVNQSFTREEKQEMLSPESGEKAIDLWAQHLDSNLPSDKSLNYYIIFGKFKKILTSILK